MFEDIEVVGEARSAIEAMQRVATAAPDVIIVDAEIPDINGLETTRILKGRGYPGAVIVLSGDIQWLEEALASRALGYLIRDAPANEVAAIIRRAPEGRFIFGASVMNTPEGLAIASRYMAGQGAGDVRSQSQNQSSPGVTEPETVESVPEVGLDPAGEYDTRDGVTADQHTASVGPPADAAADVAPSQDAAEPASPPRSLLWDVPMMEVELVISQPAELMKVVKLHQWLEEVSNAVINETARSADGDTIISVSLRRRSL